MNRVDELGKMVSKITIGQVTRLVSEDFEGIVTKLGLERCYTEIFNFLLMLF